MEFKINDIIKFKGGDYLILDVIQNNDNTYLYLINNDEYLNDVSITKVIENNGVIEYNHIDNNDEFNYVLNRLFLNIKEELIELVSEEE